MPMRGHSTRKVRELPSSSRELFYNGKDLHARVILAHPCTLERSNGVTRVVNVT
jgi:hypothetical protein